jgi:hypothetical protein
MLDIKNKNEIRWRQRMYPSRSYVSAYQLANTVFFLFVVTVFNNYNLLLTKKFFQVHISYC